MNSNYNFWKKYHNVIVNIAIEKGVTVDVAASMFRSDVLYGGNNAGNIITTDIKHEASKMSRVDLLIQYDEYWRDTFAKFLAKKG